MHFDPTNPVIALCAEGMAQEGTDPAQAAALFAQAWDLARTDLEKFTAAHYRARHQPGVAEKLHWDRTALEHDLHSTQQRYTAVRCMPEQRR